MSAGNWNAAHKVLCVRLDSLGDVLMCTPALRALRQSGRELTLLTSPSGAAAAPFIPDLAGALVYAAPWMKQCVSTPEIDAAFLATLAAYRFDAAVIFTSFSQSALPAALLCYLAGIPMRLAHCRENPYQLLTHWVPDPEPGTTVRHEVQRQLDLVAQVGYSCLHNRLAFALRDEDRASAGALLQELGIAPGRPWLLLHPGASAASRRYPPSHWAALIALLSARLGYPIVLSGDRHEVSLIDHIRELAGVPAFSLAGRLSLGELGALIDRAAVMVCNNTGPAHIAAALGTPLVDLYALTNPQHMPWKVDSRVLYHDVPCRFCLKSVCPQGHHDCLRKVSPASVLEAVCSLLGE